MGLCRSARNPCARHEPYRELPIGGFPQARKSQSTVRERRGERSGEPQAHDEGDEARQREDGHCEAMAPKRSEGVDRGGRPLGAEVNKREDLPCAWWRPRSGTTLTRAKIGKPAAGSSWKNSAEGRVGSIGRGDLEGAATTGSPEARPWIGGAGSKKGAEAPCLT